MEAFPAIVLISDDAVLAEAIPAQLKRTLDLHCNVVRNWEEASPLLHPNPPAIVLIDCLCCAAQLNRLAELREKHPLLACIGIGNREALGAEAALFSALPLAAFMPRPLSIPALIRSIEHLNYARGMTAGQQRLTLADSLLFAPALKQVASLANPDLSAPLTDKEAAILLSLYHHRHDWLSRQKLLETVWGYSDAITTHTLETHLYRLRAKLRPLGAPEELIITAAEGYRLATD